MKKTFLMTLFIILMILLCGCVSKPITPGPTTVTTNTPFGNSFAEVQLYEPRVIETVEFQQKNITPETGYKFVELPYSLTLRNTTKLPEIQMEDTGGNIIESKPFYKGVGCSQETSYFMRIPVSTTTVCNSTKFAMRIQGNVVSNQSRVLAYIMSETFQVPDTGSTKSIRFIFSLPHTADDTAQYRFACLAAV
jgi:hypothetical protein